MKEVLYGEEIRRLRIERGLSQEQLVEGICSPSTLSRIENGSQVPSNRILRLLMERLDGPGYSYAHFLSPLEFNQEVLKEDLLEAMEYGDMEKAIELLQKLEQGLDEGDPKLAQFYEMSKLICFLDLGEEKEAYVSHCIHILEIGRPDLKIRDNLEQIDMDLRIARGRMDVSRNDWVEMWILNNLALGYMWQKEYQKACQVFIFLHKQMEGNEFIKKRSWKPRGIVCNNLAVCLCQMGEYHRAKGYLEKAIQIVRKEAGVSLLLHLLSVKMELEGVTGDWESYYEDEKVLSYFYNIAPKFEGRASVNRSSFWIGKELLIL